ncbi:MAG: aromatic ring-hydroxylating dioxygenase subunit alpha [Sphingomonas sp.]|nr:aromatic ring-hydroxylating dioxygenase subunit alpha [Sphingomonas sp.]
MIEQSSAPSKAEHSTGERVPDEQALAAARRWTRDADRVGDPYRTAELFPGEIYWDEDFWRFEKWALFDREWLCVGHVGQIREPGDHFAITLMDEPLIVSRDAAGEIHVLSAICQHRGHPLMDGLAKPETGGVKRGKLLVCPYHAWSYKLDGSLMAAPGMRETANIDELRCRIRLPSIRHEIFEGLIFVNFNKDAAPITPRLERLHGLIEAFKMETLCPTEVASTGLIRSNWKIYQENSLEPYHTDVVHRNSHNPAPAHLSTFFEHSSDEAAIFTTTGFAETNELFASDGQQQLPGIPGLSEEQMSRILFVAVLPGLFLLFEPGSVLVTLSLPRGADTMELLTFSLYTEQACAVPGFAGIVAEQQAALNAIVAEDLTTQEALQRGHRSRFTPKGVLSWLETTIPQMNGWLLHRYRIALAEAEGEQALS